MKTQICLIASAVMILSTSGCATNSCNKGLFGGGLFNGRLSQGDWFQNGPLSNGPIRSFFRGAPCSTCNPPAGQTGYTGNVAPLCNDGSCYGRAPATTSPNIPLTAPGVPYYDSGNLAAPQPAIQGVAPSYGASNVTSGSANRVPNQVQYGIDSLPQIDAFSGTSIDADALPPTP